MVIIHGETCVVDPGEAYITSIKVGLRNGTSTATVDVSVYLYRGDIEDEVILSEHDLFPNADGSDCFVVMPFEPRTEILDGDNDDYIKIVWHVDDTTDQNWFYEVEGAVYNEWGGPMPYKWKSGGTVKTVERSVDTMMTLDFEIAPTIGNVVILVAYKEKGDV
jgi:hypothetical protein